MSILVVGSVALDTVKTPFGEAGDILGGSASYFSVSASFFNKVRMVAVVGSDFPQRHINFFKERGIDVQGLTVKKGKTFRWKGEYTWDFNEAKTIATHLNVFSDFKPAIPPEYRNTEYVFLANIDPALQRSVLCKMLRPKLVACDTMNYWIANKRRDLMKLLKGIDIFFLNESEARQLTGEASPLKAARSILKFGPGKVILKKGEHGSVLFSGNSVFSAPAYLLESIHDPTGAGDTFAGGVIGYLSTQKKSDNRNLKKAIAYGSVMATFAVEALSLRRLGRVKRRDIEKRFKKFKELTHF